MIEIISHRGICDSNESSLIGIQNCVNSGFGVELDLRAYNNFLYVSSGSGPWGPKMRLGTRNEVILFNLNKK